MACRNWKAIHIGIKKCHLKTKGNEISQMPNHKRTMEITYVILILRISGVGNTQREAQATSEPVL